MKGLRLAKTRMNERARGPARARAHPRHARAHENAQACASDYTTLHYTTLHYTILYYTILYYTILYYTILYHAVIAARTVGRCQSEPPSRPAPRPVGGQIPPLHDEVDAAEHLTAGYRWIYIWIYTYIYIYIHTCVYIYIYRLYFSLSLYIYIYIERERDIDR